MMHFPLCFRFPPIFQKFSHSFKILPFPEKFMDFHPPKFLMTFLVIDHKFRIPLIFPVSVHFPHVSRKLLFPPPLFRENYFLLYFENFPSFRKIHMLFTCFMCISFPPYFDHDAFMHHPMHVLDAPVLRHYNYIVKFPLFNYLFVVSLLCSQLQLLQLLFVTSLYFFFKVSIVSLPVCYVIGLFSSSAVSSSFCTMLHVFLQGFYCLIICLLLCSRLRLFHLLFVMSLSYFFKFGAFHKVRRARGGKEGVREVVTVCDRERG